MASKNHVASVAVISTEVKSWDDFTLKMESHQHLAEEQSQLHNYDWAVIAGKNADDVKYKKLLSCLANVHLSILSISVTIQKSFYLKIK